MRAFVVADAHGRWELVKGLLKQEGLHRPENWEQTYVVSLGDLINCTQDSVERDLTTLTGVGFLFDHLLVGNHEHPYFPGYITKFSGFHYDKEIAEAIEKIEYRAAFHFGTVLITHAGLGRYWEYEKQTSAAQAAWTINKKWKDDPADPLFNSIGPARGGPQRWGGILWSHDTEGKARNFSQVYGHTPRDEVRVRHAHKFGEVSHVCIDLNSPGKKERSRIGGAWIEPDGKIVPVSFSPEEE